MRFTIRLATMCSLLSVVSLAWSAAPITRIWLTHPVSDTSKLMINWETETPGASRVEFGSSDTLGQSLENADLATLHHVAVPFPKSGALHYRVSSDDSTSALHQVQTYGDNEFRVALAADWQTYPNLNELMADKPHLLVSCGDAIPHLVDLQELGKKDYTAPFSHLIDQYPELFATVPFMPAMGNHDRQLRPRMFEPLVDPTYDLNATAFRKFFPLPNNGMYWHLDIPGNGLRIAALDLSHTSDKDSNWQSCQDFHANSEQLNWYRELVEQDDSRFTLTVYNEQHRQVRHLSDGAWGKLIQRGTVAITGFGHFAERAEVEGFPFFNTALKGGDVYADKGHTEFLKAEANYVLLTVPRDGNLLTVRLKNLDGEVLDETSWPRR